MGIEEAPSGFLLGTVEGLCKALRNMAASSLEPVVLRNM